MKFSIFTGETNLCILHGQVFVIAPQTVTFILVFSNLRHLSHLVGKPTMLFPTRSDTNRDVQAQKQARSLKFWIYKVEELHYPCSENKGADQLRGYLICVFVFAYADCWFSHWAAHFNHLVFFCKYTDLLSELVGNLEVRFLFITLRLILYRNIMLRLIYLHAQKCPPLG